MTSKKDIEFKKIAIIGVGLIGGSFALSLKKVGYTGRIIGIGRKKENLLKAKDIGVIDECFTAASDGIKDADLILFSTPVGQFQKILEEVRGSIKEGAIITDVGSVKLDVVKRLEPLMPKGVSFVGSHPIAGKESSGIVDATAELFAGTRCVITPTSNTSKEALDMIANLWQALGSKVIIMTPEEHDLIFAAVSHMPHVVAYTLVNTLLELNKDILLHSGPSLKDMTRVALSSPEMWRDICSSNKDNIIQSLSRLISSLGHIKELLEKSDWHGLEEEFKKAQKGRQGIGNL